MLPLNLLATPDKDAHILCLGAHCDDIEIGCGGTLLELLANHPNLHVTWVVFASTPSRKSEAERGASLFSEGAKSLDLRILDFKDGYVPTESARLKDEFEQLKKGIVSPDLIFTHYRYDLHQDHKAVSDLTWNTFRNHLILEYEIPKWDGDMGIPNTFYPLSGGVGQTKIKHLQQAYNSQKTKKWFTDDLFWSLMRIRGMECNSQSTLAEGFHVRKMTVS
ncbi:PIG-L deacetylase family protein [Marinobacter caseinilyticus]|uniref:PIG-L deacetylase family protein n=1 Tax=Marinobacter caseinilyticus TaxID=2692195 RepID=UPI001407F26D|nr:PIG-L deacetylase family protein [Marinobacter caseinilyticus]